MTRLLIVLLWLPLSVFADSENTALFLGNSFTFGNNLPMLVQSLADVNGQKLATQKVARGGQSIAGHSKDPKSIAAIESKPWDFIVFQGQSLEPMWGPKGMVEGGKKLASHAKGSKLLMFSTWAYKTENRFIKKARRAGFKSQSEEELKLIFERMDEVLAEGYHALAKEVKGEVVPVGKVWATFVKTGSEVNLYSKDEYHASKFGTYLTAITFYKAIYGEVPKKAIPKGFDKSLHDKMVSVVNTAYP